MSRSEASWRSHSIPRHVPCYCCKQYYWCKLRRFDFPVIMYFERIESGRNRYLFIMSFTKRRDTKRSGRSGNNSIVPHFVSEYCSCHELLWCGFFTFILYRKCILSSPFLEVLSNCTASEDNRDGPRINLSHGSAGTANPVCKLSLDARWNSILNSHQQQ